MPAAQAIPSPWRDWAWGASLALVVYGVAWEAVLDPLQPGSLLWLKVVPLAVALPGLFRGRRYTYQWMSLLIWLYVCEALVRIIGLQFTERLIASGALVLSLIICAAVLGGVRASRRQTDSGEAPSQSDLRQ